jgi:hypothetical protein
VRAVLAEVVVIEEVMVLAALFALSGRAILVPSHQLAQMHLNFWRNHEPLH